MVFRLLLLALVMCLLPSNSTAKDFVLTIGGGYAPEGNQASLEANVLFFQQLIQVKHSSDVEHRIYFADGFDPKDDLQVEAPKAAAKTPALELLTSVFDFNRERLEYRNHRVPSISGAIVPNEVRVGYKDVLSRLTDGDRLIVYVTAHGSAAPGKDKMNTSIACWNNKRLSMKDFSRWLDEVPATVPVVLVMAQCYCGGFVNTMFEAGEPDSGLAKGVRVGFFAQRHDLPAAGCRPDIENDEEFSSYFWGAFLGQLRSGKAIEGVDVNLDGRISFAEAHAYAVLASPTIDIPLRTSDEFLRRYSRIAEYETPPLGSDGPTDEAASEAELDYLGGTVADIAGLASPELRKCVLGLAQQLEISPSTEASKVFTLKKEQDEIFRQSRQRPGRGGPRGARSSRRRDLRQELVTKWPELEETSKWIDLDWLQNENGESFLEQVRELPNFEPFQQSLSERIRSRERATAAELRLVRLRRLIYAMETVILSKNLPKIASQDELNKYRAIRAVEESFFDR